MNYDGTNIWQDSQLSSILGRINNGGSSSATIVFSLEEQILTSNLPEPYDTSLPVRGFSYGTSRPSLCRGVSGDYETGSDIFVKPLVIVSDFSADLCELLTRIAEMKNLGRLTLMELTHIGDEKQQVKVIHEFESVRLVELIYEPGTTVMAYRYNSVRISSVKIGPDSVSKGNVSGGLDVVRGIANTSGGIEA